MRKAFDSLILILTAALCVCIFFARRSGKPIGKSVAALIASLIPPMIGNLLIIATSSLIVADIGSYLYFLGMDLIMFFMVRFTICYCELTLKRGLVFFAYALLLADAFQLVLNPLLGHAFSHEAIEFDGAVYYRLVPYFGQTFHRAAVYLVLAFIVVRFTVMTVRSPRVDAERYAVILLAMILVAIWQSFYIFSRTPIDRSMIGFGVFGLLVFYFALYYKPVRLLNRMMAGIVGEMREALFFFDTGGKCIWVNEPGIALTGVMPGEYGAVKEILGERFGDVSLEGGWTRRFTEGSGEDIRYYVLEKRMVQDRSSLIAGSFLSVRDETEEQKERARERFLATHDQLTGLYNREFLYERIRKSMKEHPNFHWLIIFVNVKDFKIVNDIFGSEFGDLVLKEVGKWVASDMSANTVYGRLVGDTFGALMPAGEFVSERVERKLSDFTVSSGTITYKVLIHVGVFEVSDTDMDVSVMFDRARLALSTIRNDYQQHIARYGEEMRSRLLLNQQLSGQLMDAVSRQQIVPYLQPLTDREGRVAGAEALVHWFHHERGFLSPAVFIPVFEENGMIAQMDRAMWRNACAILKEWQVTHPDLFLSVNISPKDFYFMDVAAELKAIVAEFGLDPEKLRLEITETVMMTNEEKHLAVIKELREAGFMVEMDDFGSGWSSLNMLKDIPLDVLKIDMKFLSGGSEDERSKRILRSVVQLAEDLGLESIIEGVETEEQYRTLADMGCKLFQGFYIARPMSPDAFELFLQTRNRQP